MLRYGVGDVMSAAGLTPRTHGAARPGFPGWTLSLHTASVSRSQIWLLFIRINLDL